MVSQLLTETRAASVPRHRGAAGLIATGCGRRFLLCRMNEPHRFDSPEVPLGAQLVSQPTAAPLSSLLDEARRFLRSWPIATEVFHIMGSSR
jgi:hypothetical protein